MKNFTLHAFRYVILMTLASCGFKNKHADLVIHNAVIYTVDNEFSVAQAMAIENGVIIAVGPEREVMNEYSADEYIDCAGKFVYPGFIDAHCHFLAYGRTLQEVSLDSTKSFNDILSRLKEAKIPESGWLVARGWDQNDWADSAYPAIDRLDSLFPDIPVVLQRIDGHALLVNSKALTMAGLNGEEKITGGEIDMRYGLLLDNAMTKIWDTMPEKTKAEDERALLNAQDNCFKVGLTTISDAGLKKKDVDLIKELQTAGKLKIRVYAMLADDSTNLAHYLATGIDTSSNMLTVRAFKFYADGALGSRGACLLDPYNDLLPEKKYGLMLSDPDYFTRHAYLLREKGFQMCTHAIGDSANRVILDIYGEVVGDLPDHRWRIEHAQVVHESDLSKFGQFHIIPSIQPTHATSDMPWAPERLGRNRMYRAYAYRKLKEQLGMAALGTDFPVEGISPLNTFYAAVYRKRTQDISEGFQMEEALTKEDALRGMTIWAAIANFQEKDRGSIEVGKQADFIISNLDLIKSQANIDMSKAAIQTFVSGEKVIQQNN